MQGIDFECTICIIAESIYERKKRSRVRMYFINFQVPFPTRFGGQATVRRFRLPQLLSQLLIVLCCSLRVNLAVLNAHIFAATMKLRSNTTSIVHCLFYSFASSLYSGRWFKPVHCLPVRCSAIKSLKERKFKEMS